MLEEEAENEFLPPPGSKLLSSEEMGRIIQECLLSYEEVWKEKYLPKLQARRKIIWLQEWRMVVHLRQMLADYERQLRNGVKKLKETKVVAEEFLRNRCLALQNSAFGKCEALFKIDLILDPSPDLSAEATSQMDKILEDHRFNADLDTPERKKPEAKDEDREEGGDDYDLDDDFIDDSEMLENQLSEEEARLFKLRENFEQKESARDSSMEVVLDEDDDDNTSCDTRRHSKVPIPSFFKKGKSTRKASEDQDIDKKGKKSDDDYEGEEVEREEDDAEEIGAQGKKAKRSPSGTPEDRAQEDLDNWMTLGKNMAQNPTTEIPNSKPLISSFLKYRQYFAKHKPKNPSWVFMDLHSIKAFQHS